MKPRYYLRGVSEMYLCVRATLLSSDYFVRSTLKCPKEKSVDTLWRGAMKQSNPSNDDRFHVTTLRTNVDHDIEYRLRRYSQSFSDIGLPVADYVKTSCKSTSCRKLITCRNVYYPINSRQDLWSRNV